MELLELISEARKNSRKRKFTQTWDLLINLKDMDLKKPEHRFSLEFVLPEGRGKDIKVGVIADSLAAEAKKHTDLVIRKEELESLAKNKKKLKKIVNDYDWFLAEAPLMPVIGKSMGAVFGPRGKLPKPVPPQPVKVLQNHQADMPEDIIFFSLGQVMAVNDAVYQRSETADEFPPGFLLAGPATNNQLAIRQSKERFCRGIGGHPYRGSWALVDIGTNRVRGRHGRDVRHHPRSGTQTAEAAPG